MHVAVFPLLSVTVQVTVVLPPLNTEGASLVTLAIPQLSLVVSTPKLTLLAVHNPASGATVIAAGHVIAGTSTSLTVTSKLQVAVLPNTSSASNVLVVAPTGNADPLAKPAV